MRLAIIALLAITSLLVIGGCDGNSDSKANETLPAYSFSAVDSRLQEFIDDNDVFEGISVTIVDRDQGTVHEASFGDHTTSIITMLASVSKFASVTLLMAIDEDDSVDFDIDAPISNYLPWVGVYGDSTTTQLLSNTSGIPGIFSRSVWGVHECQFDPDYNFEDCSRLIYSYELPGSHPPGVAFDYGGSQWYLAGAVASQVTNSEWNQAFDRYIAEPCGLEVFKYGNTAALDEYDGNPDSLPGVGNPHAGGGAISNMQDVAKLLLLHLRAGMCSDTRVLSRDAVLSMQVNRIEGLINTFFPGRGYGMGWWMRPDLPNVIFDSGLYGSIVWIDTERMTGGFVTVDDYSKRASADSWNLVLEEIIPLVGTIVDDARLAVGQ